MTSEDLIGMSEMFKVNYINRCFEDAYKSKQSVVILDDLERIVEYVDIGRRFSNSLLQAILVLIKKLPSKSENSVAIIATCSNLEFLKEFGLYSQFNIKIEVPQLRFNSGGENEIGNVWNYKFNSKIPSFIGMRNTFKISLKKLLFTFHIMENMSKGDPEMNFKEAIRIVEGDEGDDLNTEITF